MHGDVRARIDRISEKSESERAGRRRARKSWVKRRVRTKRVRKHSEGESGGWYRPRDFVGSGGGNLWKKTG